MANKNVLYINNKLMPTPSSLSISKNLIWSANTGRASTGEMVGDIVAIKYKLILTWNHLTQDEVALIDAAVNSATFFPVKFIDPASSSGAFKTIQAQVGTPTYPVYSYAFAVPRYAGIGLDLIEK